MLLPDYKHGVLATINTIRDYIGLPYYHQQDMQVAAWLKENRFQQVILMLIDGMGAYQVKEFCEAKGFMNTHLCKSIDTVYPPTTAAATTAVRTGKAPMETGWLSWQQYIKDLHAHPIMFFNRDYYTDQPLRDSNSSYHRFPICTMVEECDQLGIPALELFPAWRTEGMDSFQKMCERVVEESNNQTKRFIYAYWDGYDAFMHEHGATHPESVQMIREFDKTLADTMASLHPNTGMIILADHGHIDVMNKHLIEYPDIMECFEAMPAFETRTVNFFIKQEKTSEFEALFQTYFGNEFELYTKQAVLDANLFGIGKAYPLFEDMLGDYLACATGATCLNYTSDYNLKGHHAGMTKKELEIPLIMVPAFQI